MTNIGWCTSKPKVGEVTLDVKGNVVSTETCESIADLKRRQVEHRAQGGCLFCTRPK